MSTEDHDGDEMSTEDPDENDLSHNTSDSDATHVSQDEGITHVSQNEGMSDEDSYMTRRIKNHKLYTRIVGVDKHLCKTTSAMEKIVHAYQKRQAESVNKKRAQYTKPVLECRDIASIMVPPQSRAAYDHPWLPVMVIQVISKSQDSTQCQVCSKEGVLQGIFQRNQLYHDQYLTADLLGINEMHAKKHKD
jgi:hypothetical protein